MVINPDQEIILRLVIAAIFGAVIGYEREKMKMPAGLRTHMLVCVGSALITLTSLLAFNDADPARVAAGIITGIGFLGAGTIFRDKNTIRGITTAADIWVIAGVGLAVGAGFYLGAFTTMVLLVVIMYYVRQFEHKK
jgi:putative Mg2+ transporter-C (MgtC) family protein